MRVAALGRATLEGLAQGGVVGIVKHMPGMVAPWSIAIWNCRW